MKEFSLRLEGETAKVIFDKGKYSIEGYDLENEKLALALRGGFGEGFGVLNVALDEYSHYSKAFPSRLDLLSEDIDLFVGVGNTTAYFTLARNEIMLRYFTYSPDNYRRRVAVSWGVGRGDATVLKRLIGDPDVGLIKQLAMLPNLGARYYARLTKHPDSEVRYYLARNPTMPKQILKILAKDSDPTIRIFVAGGYRTPIETLRKLADDDADEVLAVLFNNPEFKGEMQAKIARKGSLKQQIALAKFSPYYDALEILDYASGNPELKNALSRNPGYKRAISEQRWRKTQSLETDISI